MSPTEPIAVKRLAKYYGEVRGVENLTFTVERGGVFDFLRLKGAGKSTAIRILLGLLKPTDGRAWVLGHPATERKNEHRFGTMLPAKWMAVNHPQKRKPTAL